jgi:transposase
LLDHLDPRTVVLADKACDTDRIRELIEQQGVTPNIPPKSNRRWNSCFSKHLYRECNLIERFFIQAEALPPRRHPIRARRQLPPYGSARLNAALAPRL